MIKFGVVATCLVVFVSAQTDDQTARGQRGRGPTTPLQGFDEVTCFEDGVRYIADALNLCWYHECLRTEDSYTLQERRCPLGTRLSSHYTAEESNPCSFIYNADTGYECSRESEPIDRDEAERQLIADCGLQCFNGGSLLADVHSGLCWCNCPTEWMGEWDCSKRTHIDATPVPPSDICVDGEPPQDFCNLREGNPCLNGGTCRNECDGFVCECPTPYTYGKRCEPFSCSRDDECLNGGTCMRGAGGLNEFRRCRCTQGYFGYKCENSTAGLPIIGETDPQGLDRNIGK